jgi:outer membrane protein assembly factor BamB
MNILRIVVHNRQTTVIMKRIGVLIGVGVVSLFCSSHAWAQVPGGVNAGFGAANSAPPPVNYDAVAILRWYRANLTTAFGVGSAPTGVAFDGKDIWVTNFTSNDVTKLQASDGALLGTLAAGSSPSGVAFDGANMWIANQGSSSVTRLRASDGTSLGSFPVVFSPIAVVFDGVNIWVANLGSDNVTKLRASNGAVLGTFIVGPASGLPMPVIPR